MANTRTTLFKFTRNNQELLLVLSGNEEKLRLIHRAFNQQGWDTKEIEWDCSVSEKSSSCMLTFCIEGDNQIVRLHDSVEKAKLVQNELGKALLTRIS